MNPSVKPSRDQREPYSSARHFDLNATKPRSDKKSYRLIDIGAIQVLLIDDPVGDVSDNKAHSRSDTTEESVAADARSYSKGSTNTESSNGSGSSGGPSNRECNAYVAWCIPTGSFDDPDDLQGLAHFCEHMIFSEHEYASLVPMYHVFVIIMPYLRCSRSGICCVPC